MISFKDAFDRKAALIMAWERLSYHLLSSKPWRSMYVVPAAMASYRTWDNWEDAVLEYVDRHEPVIPQPLDEQVEWLGNIAFVKPLDRSKIMLDASDPFQSAMIYIPFMLKAYGHTVICNDLWRTVK